MELKKNLKQNKMLRKMNTFYKIFDIVYKKGVGTLYNNTIE